MKIRRILAFAVAIAMVLSIVPAMSLTASAATNTYYATAVGHSGGASGTGVFVAVGGGSMSPTGTSKGAPKTSATCSGGSGMGGDRIGFISFTVPVPTQDVIGATMRLYVTSAHENLGSSNWLKAAAYRTTGVPSSVTVGGMNDAEYPAVNDDYSYEAAYWSNEQIWTTTKAWKTFDVTEALNDAIDEAAEGAENVTLSFRLQVPVAAYNFDIAGDTAPQLVVETGSQVNVTWTVGGVEIASETLTLEDNGTAVAPAKEYSENGSNVMYASEEQVVTGDTTIKLGVVANTGELEIGDVFAKDGVQYEITSANLVPNGDFTYGLTGWYGANNGALSTSNFAVNGDGTVTSLGSKGTNDAGSLHRAWAIEDGKTYVFVQDNSDAGQYHKFSLTNTICEEESMIIDGYNATGTSYTVFTNTDGYDYAQIKYRWTTSTFGNFGLYEVKEAEVAVKEEMADVAEIAPVKVIGDTAVVLPQTVAVTGSLGSHVEAPIVWRALDSYPVGTTTVNGVATVQFGEQDAEEVDVTATVTVLEETFTLPDITTVNGQTAADEALVKFPVAISDEFNMEFTANYASFGDLWITLKDSARPLYFAPEQVPLGSNGSGAFRPVNGNGSGGRTEADSDKAQLTAGTPYRFFITTDASTDKYTVSIFDEATGAEVVTVEDFGYRTNADYIDCIVSLTNNGNGSVTLTNIKVNSTVTKTEYTFVTTKDGVTETTTGLYWTAEEAEASVEEIEGYHVDVTVDGTTITVVYTNMTVVTEEIASVAEIEDITVFVSDEIALPETVKVTGTFETVVDAPITWSAPEEFEAGATTVDGTIEVKFSETADILVHDVSINVTVIDEFTLGTVESYGAQPGHIVEFPVKIKNGFTMEFDYTINAVADASLQMGGDAGKIFGNGALGISPNGGNLAARGEGNPMLVEGVAAGETYHMILQMNAATDTYTLYVEKADGSVVTATEGFRKAQEYIDAITVLLNGNNIDNKGTIVVSDIVVNTKDVELCTVTVDGVEKKVIKGRSYKADMAGAIFDDAGVMYASENDKIEVLVENDMTLTTKALGLYMVNGAQVRIGDAALESGEKIDAMADSGLRFLAMADYNDTLLEDAEEFGIKVTAEASENVVYIKADKFQDDADSVFSAAITNLKESNYNRKYTATAYAKVNGVEITTGSVTRSIYQVSAGLMKANGAAENGDAYTVEGVVKNVLNAYVNQTGIRLGYDGTEMTVEEGKYTGDVFFTVTSEAIEGGVRVTIAPDTTWGTSASIATWWTDYVRVNNNNSVAKNYIENAQFVDGVLTFDFMFVG